MSTTKKVKSIEDDVVILQAEATPTIKEGWKTTEFWLSIATVAGVFMLLAIGRIEIDQIPSLWPIYTAVGGYAMSRGLSKS